MYMKNNKIDWEVVRINAAISIMQGLMENGKVSTILDFFPSAEAAMAVRGADALVDELKKSRRKIKRVS